MIKSLKGRQNYRHEITLNLHVPSPCPSVLRCVFGDGPFDGRSITKRAITFYTMLKFDGDGHGDGTWKILK